MERKSESEVYDEEILVGLAAATVWVMVEVMVFDCVSGKRRRKMYNDKVEINILQRGDQKGRNRSFCSMVL